MQKVIPNLWFEGNAKEAADFYVSVFPGSQITSTSYYPTEGLADFQKDMAGKELTVNFELLGYQFTGINAGPEFKFNPSISFFATCDTKEQIDELWQKLIDGGKELMPLDKYPFSERYGWVQDKYGLSWQLILNNPEGDWRPKVVPSLLFAGERTNQAEEAIEFYVGTFHDSQLGQLARYSEDTGPAKKGSLMYGDFKIEDTWLAAMDSGVKLDATFNEAVSFSVSCDNQDEIDSLWEKLSAVPESEVCGWLKDKFGVSWQIVPANMDELMVNADGSSNSKAFEAMMQMKKLNIAELEQARGK